MTSPTRSLMGSMTRRMMSSMGTAGGTLVLTLLLASLVAQANPLLLDSELPRKKCEYGTYHHYRDKYYYAHCADLKLEEIPPNLHTSIEILDAKMNRIRKLDNQSFVSYRSLKYIYLQDNFINEITEGAFGPVYYLEALDLSKCGLIQLPRSIFQLPFLRNIYVSENQLPDSAFVHQDIKAPLQALHLAFNKLTQFPQLAPLSSLAVLNISGNPITQLRTEDLAPLCQLKVLDLRRVPLRFDDSSCDCHLLRRWLFERNVTTHQELKCSSLASLRCEDARYSNETQVLFTDCKVELKVKAEAQRARSVWIWIASCISAFISSVFVVLCCVHKKNKSQRKRLKEEQLGHQAGGVGAGAQGTKTTEQLLGGDTANQE